jgi:hypothetical protein
VIFQLQNLLEIISNQVIATIPKMLSKQENLFSVAGFVQKPEPPPPMRTRAFSLAGLPVSAAKLCLCARKFGQKPIPLGIV